MAAAGSELQIPSVSVLTEDGGPADESGAVKRRARPGRKPNGVVRGDTKSLYISAGESLRTVCLGGVDMGGGPLGFVACSSSYRLRLLC